MAILRPQLPNYARLSVVREWCTALISIFPPARSARLNCCSRQDGRLIVTKPFAFNVGQVASQTLRGQLKKIFGLRICLQTCISKNKNNYNCVLQLAKGRRLRNGDEARSSSGASFAKNISTDQRGMWALKAKDHDSDTGQTFLGPSESHYYFPIIFVVFLLSGVNELRCSFRRENPLVFLSKYKYRMIPYPFLHFTLHTAFIYTYLD